MRAMRLRQNQDANKYKTEGSTYMSDLRQSFLEKIRILGNQSGCHQRPDRSFFYQGKQFPVCARCTGVFIGHCAALLLFCFRIVLSPLLCIVLLSTMGVDWGIQECGIRESTNRRRLITGILGGLGLYSMYLYAIRGVYRQLRRWLHRTPQP